MAGKRALLNPWPGRSSMEVTGVEVFPVGERPLKASANAVADDRLALKKPRVIWAGGRLFAAMPSYRTEEGRYRGLRFHRP